MQLRRSLRWRLLPRLRGHRFLRSLLVIAARRQRLRLLLAKRARHLLRCRLASLDCTRGLLLHPPRLVERLRRRHRRTMARVATRLRTTMGMMFQWVTRVMLPSLLRRRVLHHRRRVSLRARPQRLLLLPGLPRPPCRRFQHRPRREGLRLPPVRHLLGPALAPRRLVVEPLRVRHPAVRGRRRRPATLERSRPGSAKMGP